MRIAQVSPLFESVPPRLYGGTERVVAFLCGELTALGHEVTLFASGDSKTSARLDAVVPRALRLDPECVDEVAPHVLNLERVMQCAHEFDVLHFHCEPLHFSLARRQHTPHVTTLHGRLDLPHFAPLLREFSDAPLVSISDSQRAPLPQASYSATIHHGLPVDLFEVGAGQGGYFVFLGRISPEKRPDRAIEIAKRTGVPLRIAAKIGREDRAYYEREIEPLLQHPLIDFLGEINERQKGELLRDATALLFPVDWPEPFGLAMIEAMACGTPVVAWRRGSVPEVIDEGVTGFIVDDMGSAIAAARRAADLDRKRVRATFERRFSARRMAEEYVALYEQLVRRDTADGAPLVSAAE